MPRLTPQQIKEKEAIKGSPLTDREIFLPEYGLESRPAGREMSQKIAADNWRPVMIQHDPKAQALLNEIADAEKQVDHDSWKSMTEAQRRVHFANLGLADFRKKEAAANAMKAHIKEHKEKLNELRQLHERAMWSPLFSEADLASINRSIAQIEAGPDADPTAIRDTYVQAMSIPRRLAGEASTAAQAQIATLQKGLADQLTRLQVANANAPAPEPEVVEPTAEQVADGMSSYWKYYDQYKAHLALGQTEEAAAAMTILLTLHNAAKPDSPIVR